MTDDNTDTTIDDLEEELEEQKQINQGLADKLVELSGLLPETDRRKFLKTGAGAAALVAAGAVGQASAAPGDDGDTVWGTDSNRDDYYVDELDANLVNTNQLSGDVIESGTWTPTAIGWDTDPTFNTVSYYRIQDIVTITISIESGQKSGATSGYLDDLPFANANSTTAIGMDKSVNDVDGALLNSSGEIYFVQNDFSGSDSIYEFTFEIA